MPGYRAIGEFALGEIEHSDIVEALLVCAGVASVSYQDESTAEASLVSSGVGNFSGQDIAIKEEVLVSAGVADFTGQDIAIHERTLVSAGVAAFTGEDVSIAEGLLVASGLGAFLGEGYSTAEALLISAGLGSFATLASILPLNAKIAEEVQKLVPSALIELFVLDLTELGDEIYRFHAGTNGLKEPLVWQGNTYTPFPVKASGFDLNAKGQLPRPKIAFANVNGTVTAFILAFNDCLGAKVVRKRTLLKFLDEVNFPDGINPTADPTAEFPEQVFFIDRKAHEDKITAEFELSSSFDIAGKKIPGRQIVHLCQWRYRGEGCLYAGTDYFKSDDTPTVLSGEDVCGKRLSSCKARFGQNAPLPFGGFPGAGREI